MGALFATLMTALGFTSPAHAEEGPLPLPVLRLHLGPTFRVSDEPNLAIVHLGLEPTVGVIVFGESEQESPSWVFNAEAGGYFDTADVLAFNLAAGIGYGSRLVSVMYHPRLLVGSHFNEVRQESDRAIGMRNGIGAHFVYDIFSAELGHQFIQFEDTLRHEITLTFGANPGAALYLLVKIVTEGLR